MCTPLQYTLYIYNLIFYENYGVFLCKLGHGTL
jgi:hypothetical protein